MAKGNQTHLSQGEGGGGSTRASGSHKDPTGEGRVNGKGKSGDHLTPTGEGRANGSDVGGSHLEQGQAHGSPRAPQRGGDNRDGYDHTDPTLGKSKSGSKFKQNPGFYR